MNFNEYQELAGTTAIYPGKGETLGLAYVALGLGESGEVQGKVKKMIRDGYDRHSKGEALDKYVTAREAIIAELGDVLWYVANAATELGVTFDTVAEGNLAKLASRQLRGVLQGSGDNR